MSHFLASASPSSSSSSSSSSFELPEIWKFPPFFTMQPVLVTREKQLEHWRQLVISYQTSIASFRLVPATFPYFKNETLDRRLSSEGIDLIIQYMIDKGNAEWEDGSKTSLFIFFKNLATVADDLYNWADRKGLINNVVTVFELYSGDEHSDTGLVGIDVAIVRKVLDVLERKNKCIYIHGGTPEDDGVKFL